MTNKELITYGKDYLHDLETACCKIEDTHLAFVRNAIKALEQEPCTDAVSREVAIDYVKSYIHEIITESGTDKNEHTNNILRMIVDGLNEFPSVQPVAVIACVKYDNDKLKEIAKDAANNILIEYNWHPVTEPPKEMGTYIATVDYGEHGFAVGQRYYFGKYVGWDDERVVAWMPLPTPYEPQESEGDNGNDD